MKKKTKVEMARKMLEEGFAIDTIVKITSLKEEEIENYKRLSSRALSGLFAIEIVYGVVLQLVILLPGFIPDTY